jgi:cbb3-type cytochrome oxidase subunit 3
MGTFILVVLAICFYGLCIWFVVASEPREK